MLQFNLSHWFSVLFGVSLHPETKAQTDRALAAARRLGRDIDRATDDQFDKFIRGMAGENGGDDTFRT